MSIWEGFEGGRETVQEMAMLLVGDVMVWVCVVEEGGSADMKDQSSSVGGGAVCAEAMAWCCCGGMSWPSPKRSSIWLLGGGLTEDWNWKGDAPRGVCEESEANGSGLGDGAALAIVDEGRDVEATVGGENAERPPNVDEGGAGEGCWMGAPNMLVICALESWGCDEGGGGDVRPFEPPRESAPPCP